MDAQSAAHWRRPAHSMPALPLCAGRRWDYAGRPPKDAALAVNG